MKDIRNLFRLEKETKPIKNRIISNIKNLLKHEEEDYKPVRVNKFWSSNYIEYGSNSDRNKTLSDAEYLNKIRLCLKYIINILKKSATWKIQLTIANNCISSKDNDEERIIYSKSDGRKVMITDEVDEDAKQLFDSLKSRYQSNLESMKGTEFVFDYDHLLYYKCHKINANCHGSYTGSPNRIKNEKATINTINKKIPNVFGMKWQSHWIMKKSENT